MDCQPAHEFKHTTLADHPGSPLGRDESGNFRGYSPETVGVTLLDEAPGFTGIYLRDAAGGLWPARTVNREYAEHHESVCNAWLSKPGIHQDKRSKP